MAASKPLYPCGYGLSYTTFTFSNIRLAPSRVRPGDSVTVLADVTNSGSLAGEELAQLYIHQRYGSASRPVRRLEGFRRLALNPGQTTTMRFTLGRNELQFWSPEAKKWVVESSTFDIWVGGDSEADLHAELAVQP